jgi:hypothetical protein
MVLSDGNMDGLEINGVAIMDSRETCVPITGSTLLALMASSTYSGLWKEHNSVCGPVCDRIRNHLLTLPISSAIIHDIARKRATGLVGMAYYYFDFRDVKKQDRYGLLSSLLSQLSARSDPCYEVLSQLYSGNAGGAEKPDSGVLTKCIKDMLCLPGQDTIYIVIDALDECPDTSGIPSAREEVLELIEELASLNRSNVHLCVASRPEIDIRNALEPLKPLEISLHDEDGQKNDITEYIKSVVYSDRRMQNWREEDKQLVIDTLSDKADGM